MVSVLKTFMIKSQLKWSDKQTDTPQAANMRAASEGFQFQLALRWMVEVNGLKPILAFLPMPTLRQTS